MAKELPGRVELGLKGKATVVDGTTHLLRPLCTYLTPYNETCRKPAHYEFELDPRSWPGARPPIIQYACEDHGKDARSLTGVIRFVTL